MSEEKHTFHIASEWVGGSMGDGAIHTEAGDILAYGVPADLGGKPGRSNPEEMLLNAVTACYSITLAILAERRRLPVERIQVSAEADVFRQPDKTLKYKTIRLHPVIALASDDEAHKKTVEEFAHKAETYCVISNAIRGNVEIVITPEIVRA